jgi:predicted HD phosphohydrolase
MLDTVQDIIDLYAARGGAGHGSGLISQVEHALQCASLARQHGATDELLAAAFLHDIGHIVIVRPRFVGREIDDLHQFVALPFLRSLFGAAVLEPIRLHVDAKRYLGGPMSNAEASAFLRHRFAGDAIRLRRWDDAARVPGLAVPELAAMGVVLEAAAGCHKTATAGA